MAESDQLPAAPERRGAGIQQWLSLKEASDFLGVHFTTLRAWADQGAIRVFRTPGGHRRFSLADLRRFLDERIGSNEVNDAVVWVDSAVDRVRQEIEKLSSHSDTQWLRALDESERDLRRERGRRLFSLAIAYVLKPKQRGRLLEDARSLGREYGREVARSGLSVVEAGRAVQFFRNQLVQTVHHSEGPDVADADDIQLHRLIHQFLDEVLYAVLEGYEAGAL